MGLIGHPSSVRRLTTEMNPEEFDRFRSGWIRYETIKLVRDGVSEPIAKRTAEDEFFFLQKKGFQEINASRLRNRQIRAAKL